ncbi:MAG: hypothetical protein HC819_04330 [Cyclobacteriaceae bacterium]|nr:hypothetical protein [Cyclobacteriaceae bacterium]
MDFNPVFYQCGRIQLFFYRIAEHSGKNVAQVAEKLGRELDYIEPLINALRDTIAQAKTHTFEMLLQPDHYPYYIFSNKRMVFWSNNLYAPKYRDILGTYTLRYIETEKGKYVVRKAHLEKGNRKYEIVFLIPLTETSNVVNQYLKNTFNEQVFTDANFEIKGEKAEDFQALQIEGNYLFSLKFGTAYSNSDRYNNLVALVLIGLAFLFLGLFIKKQLNELVRKKDILYGFLFLLGCILLLRGAMLWARFPLDFVYLGLFDPKHYGSTLVNPSLGDLLLNLLCLLFLGIYIFRHFLRSALVRRMLGNSTTQKTIWAGVLLFFSFFWLAVHHQTMKTLNEDSQWSMDISQQLEFNYLKVIGYLLFFISVVVYFLFAHISFRLVGKLTRHHALARYGALGAGMLLFLSMALLLRWDFEVVLGVNLLFFLAVDHFRLGRYLGKLQYLTFIYLFSFGLPGAIIGVYANYQHWQKTPHIINRGLPTNCWWSAISLPNCNWPTFPVR